MIFEFDISDSENESLQAAENMLNELNQALIDSTLEGNSDAVVSPQVQAKIMALNGYIGMIKDTIVNPLEAHLDKVGAQLDALKNFCKTAEGVINKAQRATSQITNMMKRV